MIRALKKRRRNKLLKSSLKKITSLRWRVLLKSENFATFAKF